MTQDRLHQVMSLLEKEALHLKAVSSRLFKGDDTMTFKGLEELLESPQGIDTLESFGAKFARMQDTLVDKMLPLFLKQAGEKTGTVIENLNRAEKLGLINDVEQWLAARTLRNKLVHEYIEELEEIVGALNWCKIFVDELIRSHNAFREYIKSRLT